MTRSSAFVSISHTVRGSKSFEKALKEAARTAMYVGIASGSKGDKRSDESGISNSQLGFVHEFGSPAANIPARPFLVPGVKSVMGDVKAQMADATRALLKKDGDGFQSTLERCALSTADAVREYVMQNQASFVPLSGKTLKSREKKIAKVGGTPDKITILMDTNSLLRAVDGVVVKE